MPTTHRTHFRHLLSAIAFLGALTFLGLAGTASADSKAGTQSADRLIGTAGADQITARRGADTVSGRAGSDRLAGGPGGDRIMGGPGSDRLTGGPGRDRISGGSGADRLRAVRGRDRVVNGGAGLDTCIVSPRNRSRMQSCETTMVVSGAGAGGGPGAGGNIAGDPSVIEGKNCLGAAEDRPLPADRANALRRDDDPAPVFSPGLFATWITLNASVDGVEGSQMPISIEEVCDVPPALTTEATQLAGGSGIALLGSQTQVYDAGQLVTGDAAITALMGADTLLLRARLLNQSSWGMDEDGAAVPTFATGRIEISD